MGPSGILLSSKEAKIGKPSYMLLSQLPSQSGCILMWVVAVTLDRLHHATLWEDMFPTLPSLLLPALGQLSVGSALGF